MTALVLSSLVVGGVMSLLRAETQRRKEEATLTEKSARASRWALTEQAVEGLMLSLATLSESTKEGRDYSPDVQYNALKSIRSTAQLARESNVLLGHDQDVLVIAVDPKGRFIASAGKDRRLKLWDTKSGELLTQQPEPNESVTDKKAIEDGYVHKSSIYDIAISQNGEYLASTGNDAVIVIWKIIKVDGEVTLSAPHKITEHEGSVRAVDFNPEDNHQLVSGGDDGTLRLWKVETEKAKPGKIKHQAIDVIR